MLRSGAASLTPSRNLRALVYLSILLLLFMSTAQAAHHHGLWAGGAEVRASGTPHIIDASDTEASELTCPLCVVSHSVLPSFPALIARLDFCSEILSFVVRAPEPVGFWTYDLFGRPPPHS
jgi:hypothetical protein